MFKIYCLHFTIHKLSNYSDSVVVCNRCFHILIESEHKIRHILYLHIYIYIYNNKQLFNYIMYS